MLNNQQFIWGGVAVVILSLVGGASLFLSNSFADVIVYQKAELATALPPITLESLLVVASSTEVSERRVEIKAETETEEFVIDKEKEIEEAVEIIKPKNKVNLSIPIVPFYSQFEDISSTAWKKVGCGVASLAMLIEYYNPGKVVVDTLLEEGIAASAYLDNAGWTYAGLIGISKKYGLGGETHDYGNQSMEKAYSELLTELKEGPVMASVHYTFQKTNPIPHLVIINGIEDGTVYYNDPAEKTGGGSISVAQFQSAWKKRYIEFRLL